MRQASDPKAFAKALATYCDMMADGKGAKRALEATGLSHAQADLAWYGDSRNPNRVEPKSVVLPPLPGSKEPGYEVALQLRGLIVAELRAGTHPLCVKRQGEQLSWGQIAVVVGLPASTVERYFKAATGLSADGMRKGHGGRYLGDEPRYYTGNRKAIGVEDPNPKRLDIKALQATADTVTSVLPSTTKRLATQLRKPKKRSAKRASAAKKAAAQKATPAAS
jgi:AraC-like DNA-binding protein